MSSLDTRYIRRTDKFIDEMWKCIERVCAVSSNSKLKFKPYEKFKVTGTIFRIQQKKMSTEDFVTHISDKIDAHDRTTCRLWYGTPILVYSLEERIKTLKNCLEYFTDIERKRYEALALDALKAFIFIRGC